MLGLSDESRHTRGLKVTGVSKCWLPVRYVRGEKINKRVLPIIRRGISHFIPQCYYMLLVSGLCRLPFMFNSPK